MTYKGTDTIKLWRTQMGKAQQFIEEESDWADTDAEIVDDWLYTEAADV